MYIAKNLIGGKEKVEAFIRKYEFLPYKELIQGFDEDEDRLYVDYNTYKLEKLGDMPPNRNVWCFDKKTGKRLWVIEEAKGESSPYSGAMLSGKTGILTVHIMGGWNYDLDPETGKISNPVFTK